MTEDDIGGNSETVCVVTALDVGESTRCVSTWGTNEECT